MSCWIIHCRVSGWAYNHVSDSYDSFMKKLEDTLISIIKIADIEKVGDN